MISSAYRYLRHYGLAPTVAAGVTRIQTRILGHPSYTVVLHRGLAPEPAVRIQHRAGRALTAGLLEQSEIARFELQKFYPFIDTVGWLERGAEAVVARADDDIIGYVWLHPGPHRDLPGLGRWHLEGDEWWVGPTFVQPQWRSKGIHTWLLSTAVAMGRGRSLFTAINVDNPASLTGFLKVGFSSVALIRRRKTVLAPSRTVLVPLSGDAGIPERFEDRTESSTFGERAGVGPDEFAQGKPAAKR